MLWFEIRDVRRRSRFQTSHCKFEFEFTIQKNTHRAPVKGSGSDKTFCHFLPFPSVEIGTTALSVSPMSTPLPKVAKSFVACYDHLQDLVLSPKT